jgi:hypothetical protein
MAALPIVCPAAVEVRPVGDAPSIVCQVLERTNDDAEIGGVRERGQVSALFSGTRDAGTVHGFCCGQGVTGSPSSYASCAIWEAAKEAHWAARAELRDGQAHRPPVIDPELREFVKLQAGLERAR